MNNVSRSDKGYKLKVRGLLQAKHWYRYPKSCLLWTRREEWQPLPAALAFYERGTIAECHQWPPKGRRQRNSLGFPCGHCWDVDKNRIKSKLTGKRGKKGCIFKCMKVWKLEEVSKLAKGGQNKKNQEKRFSGKSRCYVVINALSTIRDKLLSNIFKVSLTLNMFHACKVCGPRRRWAYAVLQTLRARHPDFQNSTMWSNLTDCEQSWEQWKEATEKLRDITKSMH